MPNKINNWFLKSHKQKLIFAFFFYPACCRFRINSTSEQVTVVLIKPEQGKNQNLLILLAHRTEMIFRTRSADQSFSDS